MGGVRGCNSDTGKKGLLDKFGFLLPAVWKGERCLLLDVPMETARMGFGDPCTCSVVLFAFVLM